MAGDPYKELGVSKGASADEVKKAYRKLAKELHPDKNPGDKITEDKFKRVTAAFDILGDKDKRAKYDAARSTATATNSIAASAEAAAGVRAAIPSDKGGAIPSVRAAGRADAPISRASIWTTCSGCSAGAVVSAARATSPRGART